jgi:hypothetical protein
VSDGADLAGTTLADRYRIEMEIGRGGMSVVYLAHDLRHDRPVAVKLLRPDVAASIGGDRFQREIEIEARLQHPNILPVYDSGSSDGSLWFVMPFVEGDNLAERLEREGPLSAEEATRIVTEVAGALRGVAVAPPRACAHEVPVARTAVLAVVRVGVVQVGKSEGVSQLVGEYPNLGQLTASARKRGLDHVVVDPDEPPDGRRRARDVG